MFVGHWPRPLTRGRRGGATRQFFILLAVVVVAVVVIFALAILNDLCSLRGSYQAIMCEWLGVGEQPQTMVTNSF